MTTSSKLVKTPIFLVGAERSGTTLLRLMLDHHPQITWGSEFEYVVDKIQNNGEFPPLAQYYEWLETHRGFQGRNLRIDKKLNYGELVNSFLEQQREKTDKPILGSTVHRDFDKLLLIWQQVKLKMNTIDTSYIK